MKFLKLNEFATLELNVIGIVSPFVLNVAKFIFTIFEMLYFTQSTMLHAIFIVAKGLASFYKLKLNPN
jgi:hypothetical protein